jgi:hypothetical protein
MTAILDWLRANWLLLTLIGGMATAFVLLRTTPTAGIDSAESLDLALTTGEPAVLEFYSNF